LNEAVDYVKTELMPDFDFDAFNHEDAPSSGDGEYSNNEVVESSSNGTVVATPAPVAVPAPVQEAPAAEVQAAEGNNLANEEVDKW
jgi:hypothetical protein